MKENNTKTLKEVGWDIKYLLAHFISNSYKHNQTVEYTQGAKDAIQEVLNILKIKQ